MSKEKTLTKVIQSKENVIESMSISDGHYDAYRVAKKVISEFHGTVEEVEIWDTIQNGDGIVHFENKNSFTIKIPNKYNKYSDDQVEENNRKKAFVVIHELGHVLLGHLQGHENKEFKDVIMYRKKIDYFDGIEVEAETFAYLYFIDNDLGSFVEKYESTTDKKELVKLYGLNEEKLDFLYDAISYDEDDTE